MGNAMSEREEKESEFGERIYEIVQEIYPESSENITGMLLEAEYDELERLLTTTGREELEARIHAAARNLHTSNFSEREYFEQANNKDNGNHSCGKRPSDLLQELTNSDSADNSHIPASGRRSETGASRDQNGAFENKQALGETIYSLLENKHPDDAEKLTGILLEMDSRSLEHLIRDTHLLENKVEEVLAILQNASEEMQNGQGELVLEHCRDKSVIGEELYDLVSAFNTEQADKITGMLLEMDAQDLEVLVKNPAALEEKVNQAMAALKNQLTKAGTASLAEEEPEKMLHGEKLYHVISEWYPDQADKITGMLLELDVSALSLLLEDSVSLKEKVSNAANALNKGSIDKEIPCDLVEDKKLAGSGMRHSLVEQLYNIIKEWYPDEAGTLTENLMDSDQDCATLQTLVLNKQLLKDKIERVLEKKHTTKQTVPSRESEEDIIKEELGGQLYELVEESHPENADKITGMLLEMSVTDIEYLLRNPQDLEEKIQLAEKALV